MGRKNESLVRSRSASQSKLRRRFLQHGIEQLEDRVQLTVTTVNIAGALTFTSDGASDRLVIEASSPAGTIKYDDGSGFGATTVSGITSVVFNGNGGDDELALYNPDPAIFNPAGGIVFNGGANNDLLQLVGGSVANFPTGTYNVTGTASGDITYNVPGTDIMISFADVETVNDTTLAGSVTTNTSTAAENVFIEPGPVLTPFSSFVQGPVFIDGGDRDDHGFATGGGNISSLTVFQDLETTGWSLTANANIDNAVTRPHISVTGTGNGTVDFYQFQVTGSGTGTFDIDGTVAMDSYIVLYNDHGDVLAANDDNGGDSGSSSGLDSYLTFAFTSPGIYHLGVAECCGGEVAGGFNTGVNAPDVGDSYTLHFSIDGHAIGGTGTVVEVEPNQATIFAPAGNADGWLFIEQALDFVHDATFNPDPQAAIAGHEILAIGVTGSTALAALNSAAAAHGLGVTVVTGAAINTVDFRDYDLFYVPSNDNNVSGGISNADRAALAGRKVDIQTFVRQGGGIVALTDAASGGAPYPWLEIPLPFTITDFTSGGISRPLRKTPEAIAAGFTISDAELSNGVPYHNSFTGPVGFNGLDIFVLDDGGDGILNNGNDRAITLGQGAINETIGGGDTTVVRGNLMPTIRFGQKSGLNVDARGGLDTILVDGTVDSLDGILAPLSINGGGQNDTLVIDDTADLTGDTAVHVTATGLTGIANNGADVPINYSNVIALTVRMGQGNDTLTMPALINPGFTTLYLQGGLGNDTFGQSPPLGNFGDPPTGNEIVPGIGVSIVISGEASTSTSGPNPTTENDQLNLDLSAYGASGEVVDAVTGQVLSLSSAHTPMYFNGIEDYNEYDLGELTNAVIGDLYVRTAPGAADTLVFYQGYTASADVLVKHNGMLISSTPFRPTNKIVAYGRDMDDSIELNYTIAGRLRVEFYGEGGNDSMWGGSLNDLLVGGDGSDKLVSYDGNDTLWGDNVPDVWAERQTGTANLAFPSNDSLYGGNGADFLFGGSGNDGLFGEAGDDYSHGGDGNDTISDPAGTNILRGEAGADTLTGGSGSDIVLGGSGNDIITANNGRDIMIGGLGLDTIQDSNDSADDVMIGDSSPLESDNPVGLPPDFAVKSGNDLTLDGILAAWNLGTPFLARVTALKASGIKATSGDGSRDTLRGNQLNNNYFQNFGGLELVRTYTVNDVLDTLP